VLYHSYISFHICIIHISLYNVLVTLCVRSHSPGGSTVLPPTCLSHLCSPRSDHWSGGVQWLLFRPKSVLRGVCLFICLLASSRKKLLISSGLHETFADIFDNESKSKIVRGLFIFTALYTVPVQRVNCDRTGSHLYRMNPCQQMVDYVLYVYCVFVKPLQCLLSGHLSITWIISHTAGHRSILSPSQATKNHFIAVASLGRWRTAAGDTIQGVTPE